MADPREKFSTLEDASTKVGLTLTKVAEGDASAGKNYLGALTAKDISGNLRFPLVDAQNRLSVVTDSGNEACLSSKGELAAGSATLVDVTGSPITLVPDLVYEEIGFIFSCRQDALFQIVQTDDVTDTVLAEIVIGAGQYTVAGQLHCLSFTAGSTGTQELKVVAKNFDALPLSSLRATLTVSEIEP